MDAYAYVIVRTDNKHSSNRNIIGAGETQEIAVAYAANYARGCCYGGHNKSTVEVTRREGSDLYITVHLWKHNEEIGQVKFIVERWAIIPNFLNTAHWLNQSNYCTEVTS